MTTLLIMVMLMVLVIGDITQMAMGTICTCIMDIITTISKKEKG